MAPRGRWAGDRAPGGPARRPHRAGSNDLRGWGTTADNLRAFLTSRGTSPYRLIESGVVPSTTIRRLTGGDWLGYLKTWHEIAGHFGACVSELCEPDEFRERAEEWCRSRGWAEPGEGER